MAKFSDAWTVIISSAPLLAAFSAVAGGLFSAFVSATVARRSVYIGTVTVERSKWIDKIRTNISELVGAASYLHYKIIEHGRDVATKKNEDLLKRTAVLMAVTRLQLNPRGGVDANLIRLLRTIPSCIEADNGNYDTLEKLLVGHSQWLLKSEWEKVKYESRGPTRYVSEPFKRLYRRWLYRRYCKSDGALPSFVVK